jgi:hypothetical protein
MNPPPSPFYKGNRWEADSPLPDLRIAMNVVPEYGHFSYKFWLRTSLSPLGTWEAIKMGKMLKQAMYGD